MGSLAISPQRYKDTNMIFNIKKFKRLDANVQSRIANLL